MDTRARPSSRAAGATARSSQALERDAIHALRFLAIDAVERAKSGHPGAPLALAPLAYLLYTRHLRHDPSAPHWIDRDRLVLSAGHASMLLYGALHLCGYDLSLEELQRFRQWGSRTPGHPERGETPGVEVTTGPLGQGFANGVGLAIAERLLAERFNRPGHSIVDHRTFVIASDGDLMEGISYEAAALAGRLGAGLSKLTVFYDDNSITLDGVRAIAWGEDVRARFEAAGWQVLRVEDGEDLAAIDRAIDEAEADRERPTLVVLRTHIGFGSPKQDSHEAHGAPLGAAAVEATRAKLGWPHPPFVVPEELRAHWRERSAERAGAHADWRERLARYRAAHPDLAAELERVFAGRLPEGWRSALPRYEPGAKVATRRSAADTLAALSERVPELVGGSADLSSSTYHVVPGSPIVNEGDWSGRNLWYGVREHAMGAISNGIAAHGGLRPFCSTFLVFSDYMRTTIRLASLMHLPVVFVFTHDSIGVGEDGPTHQPIEQVASLRAIPGVTLFRPADANESAAAWAAALESSGPSVLVLTRQALPALDPALLDVGRGASLLAPGDDVALVASGSEVQVALAARAKLAERGVAARVLSMPSLERFRALAPAERQKLLPPALPTVAVEAGSPQGWHELADEVVGLERFGASAPADVLFRELGITPEEVVERALGLLGRS